jgi:dolichol-phosphate mannosyltransferase
MLSTFANWYVRTITRLPVHDCTSGFRCWTRGLLARLPLDRIVSDGYAFQVEMAWEAHRAGGRIIEVPITFVERREGRSKMSGRVIAESAILPWRMVTRPRPEK